MVFFLLLWYFVLNSLAFCIIKLYFLSCLVKGHFILQGECWLRPTELPVQNHSLNVMPPDDVEEIKRRLETMSCSCCCSACPWFDLGWPGFKCFWDTEVGVGGFDHKEALGSEGRLYHGH